MGSEAGAPHPGSARLTESVVAWSDLTRWIARTSRPRLDLVFRMCEVLADWFLVLVDASKSDSTAALDLTWWRSDYTKEEGTDQGSRPE